MDEAKRVLEKYFYYLKNGGTLEILNLITGLLLKKQEGLLRNNLQYGNFLQERYKSANFLITAGSLVHNNRLSLRASIAFDEQQKLDIIFTFVEERGSGRLKIYSEEEL